MNKHAYLIIAHNNWNLLNLLLKSLDREEHDFYVHIDSKVDSFDETVFNNVLKKSNIFFIERKSVKWADYSQIDVTLDLLQCAKNRGGYSYYHLLSGSDMPIKSAKYIYDFFENSGKEYIGVASWERNDYVNCRVKYYHCLTKLQSFRNSKLLKGIDRLMQYPQKIIGIDRTKGNKVAFCDGWQWFSITNEFCEYILSKREYIKDTFCHTLCPDEIVFQTLAYNSDYKENLASFGDLLNGSMRYIDWNRGKPYTWGQSEDDYRLLIDSPYLFARKFDENINFEIVKKIYGYVTAEVDNE